MESCLRTSVLDQGTAAEIFGRVSGTPTNALTHEEARASWLHLFASDGAGIEFLCRADWLSREDFIRDLNEVWEWDRNVEAEDETEEG